MPLLSIFRHEEGYPKTVTELNACGIHLCLLSQTDNENVNQVPWQKGIYVNGNEEELKNAILLYDRFFHYRQSSQDFAGKPPNKNPYYQHDIRAF